MIPRIVEARHVGDHVLWLRFSDGVQGKVDLRGDLWGEVFEPLRDETRFADVRVDASLGTVSWPNGADFAPEYLYERVQGLQGIQET